MKSVQITDHDIGHGVHSTVFFGALFLTAMTTEIRIVTLEKLDIVQIHCFERRYEIVVAVEYYIDLRELLRSSACWRVCA